MYVVQHSEASVHAIGSTGTKIAIIRVPSGKAVQLINIKKGESKIDRFILYTREVAENIRKRGRRKKICYIKKDLEGRLKTEHHCPHPVDSIF